VDGEQRLQAAATFLQRLRRNQPIRAAQAVKNPAAAAAESALESCFSKPPESAFADLEKG
jgi:hypothetical protein